MVASAQLIGADGASYNDQGVAATGASVYLTDPLAGPYISQQGFGESTIRLQNPISATIPHGRSTKRPASQIPAC